jgi:hypothetical protein
VARDQRRIRNHPRKRYDTKVINNFSMEKARKTIAKEEKKLQNLIRKTKCANYKTRY